MLSYLAQATTMVAAAAGDAVATSQPVASATADEVLSPYVYVFYAAFLVAFFFTPIMRQVALYYGIIDEPDLVRKLHTSPVAYLGGVAVFLGWLAGLAISQFASVHRPDSDLLHLQVPVPILIAAAMIVILGLWDDIRKVQPWFKITVQIAAALVLLYGGIGSHAMEPLFAPVQQRIEHYYHWTPAWYETFVMVGSGFITVGLVVACCNATNLMDGLDGLCGGVTAVIAAGFVFLAVHMAMYGRMENANADGMRVVLGLALLGAVLGFVPFNFNPASIFLGDTGSMFVGFACATLIVMMAEEKPRWFLASMVMFALPVLDTTLAFARRWVNKRPLFSADRHHFHHQLVARGFTVKQTVIISYGLATAFVLLGGAIVFIRTRYVAAVYMVVFGSIIVAAYKMGMVHEKPRVVTRRPLGADALLAAPSEVEPGQVLEVRDNEHGGGNGKPAV
ncbi:MAG TPA: MraY family glycosyltransferase [Tepidisphaeraceae bacterium]|nr:MraY family glycosyltransferase [Tepidisphaeraceae bacterium]